MQKRKLPMTALAIGVGLTAYGQEKAENQPRDGRANIRGGRTDPIRAAL